MCALCGLLTIDAMPPAPHRTHLAVYAGSFDPITLGHLDVLRRARRLFLPLALATALTFLGSLATGWHYAVDGYAGMLLAWVAVRIADRVEGAPPPAAPPVDPAEGGDGGGRVAALSESPPAAP